MAGLCEPPKIMGVGNMSMEEEAPPTTTLSTIVVQSGDTRIVIALLQCGGCYTLRILEMAPSLPSLGDTLEEASLMREAHDTAIMKLQSKQNPVEEMLRQADSMLAGQRPRPEVYGAMAASLGHAWKALNEQLEKRKAVLDGNLAFQSRASQLRDCISQLEREATSEYPQIRDVESVRMLLARLQNARKSCLEASMNALKEGHAVLEILRDLKRMGTVDSRPDFIVEDVDKAIAKVERWLENLHDRRLRVEFIWKKRRNTLEQAAAVCVVHRELDELQKALDQKKEKLLQKDSLGDSPTSAEHHTFEHQRRETDIKELRERAVKATKTAEKLLGSSCSGSADVQALAYSLLEQCADLQEIFDNRTVLLGMAVQFFRTAQTTITKLDQLDVQLATSTFAPGSVGLGRLHAQAVRAMEEATAPALHHGYDLLEATGSSASGSQGVKNMVDAIEKRSSQISLLCTAHKEEAIRNLEQVQVIYTQIDEVYIWLKNVAEGLIRTHPDLGVNQSSAGEFLELHKQMLNDVMMKGQEIEMILRQLPSVYEITDEPHSTNLQLKFEELKDTWHSIKSILDTRVDCAQTYHRFHSLAIACKSDLDELENLGRENMDVRERHLAAKQKYLQLDLIGRNFVEDCPKNQDECLDTPKAALCVEALLEHLEKRYNDVTELLNQQDHRKHQEQQLHDRWSRISLDVDGIGQRMKDVANQIFPIIPSEISINMVVTKLEDKSMRFSKDVGALAEELKIKLNALESFADSDENVRELMNKLNGHNSELSKFSFEVSNLIQMTAKYYKSLVQIDQTIEALEHQFYTTVLPANVPDIELIIRDHVANYNLLANLIANTKGDCDTLLSQYRDMTYNTRHDIDTLMHSLDQRSRHWEAVWQERNWRLTQHRQHCQFNADLMNVQNQIDDMMRQLESIKNAGKYASSLNMCRTNSDAFSQFEQSVDTIEPKIQNFVSTAEKIIGAENDEGRREPVESGINTVTTKWSSLRTNVGETREVLELRTTYFTIIEEVEEWFTSGSRLLVSLARRSALCKSKSDADELIQEVRTFVITGERQQEERIKKISSIAIQLQAPEGARQSELVMRECRDVFESFTSITKELVILSTNLQTAEDEKKQARVTEAVFRESLATAHAEAEAARAAARAAEQARIAAESIALSFSARPKSIVETTQTEFNTQCDFGLQVNQVNTKRVRLSDVSIQSDEPPVFTETLHNETITEGQKITLRCKVAGRPRPEISWYKDGIAIDNNPDYQTSCIDNICKLHIDETFAEDTAVFTCRAVSFAGVAETSAKLTVNEVQQREELLAPDFTKPLVNCTVREGGSIQFSCSITGCPAPAVSWYRNGKCVDDQPEYTIRNENEEYTLTIDEVFLEDQAQFICHATNCVGEAESTAMLNVEPLTPSEPPVILTPLSNVMARAGRKFRLEAKIKGKPQPNVVWMHNGRPIKETRELKTLANGENCTLIITEAFPKDSGVYTVSAKNIAGEASSSSSVTVKGRLPAENSDTELGLSDIEPTRPSFIVPLNDIGAVEGNKVRLECIVAGQPDPEISWYRNNVLITDAGEYQQIFQGNKSALILRQARLYDAGVYKVVGINSAGEASSECHLSVEENLTPPRFTKLLDDVVVKVNQRARFEAQITGKPEPDITWLKDNEPLPKSSRHSLFNMPDGVYVLEIPHVDSSYEGTYVIKAQNKAGEAKCIAELVLRGPTPPPPPKPEDLMTPPQFEKLFCDNRVHNGTPVSFQCIISGLPEPTVRWLYQGKPAEAHPDILITKLGYIHTFSIQVADVQHSGKVVCTAENPAGVASCAATLAVHVPPAIYQSSFSVKHIAMQTSTEVADIKEQKESVDVKETSTETIDAPRLSVKERANIFSSSQIVAVEPQQPKFSKAQQKLVAPKFVMPLTSCHVEEGSRLTMEAVIEGHPPPQIAWKFNGKELVSHDRLKTSLDFNHVRLTFSDVTADDAGEYCISATNKAGSATSTAQLGIRKPVFPPVIGRRIQPVSVKQGERVHLEIEVTGMPAPEVTWFKNEIIIEDPRVVRRSEGARYSITIGKAIPEDSGRYRACAQNQGGRSESSTDVLVQPSKPEMNPAPPTLLQNTVYDSRVETRHFSSISTARSTVHSSEQTSSAYSRVAEHKKILEIEAKSLGADKIVEESKIEPKPDPILEKRSIIISTETSDSSRQTCSEVRTTEKKTSPKREPMSEKVKRLDEFSKSLSPTPVPGGVRLLPTPTEEKPKPSFIEERIVTDTRKSVQKKELEFKFDPFKELEPFPFAPEAARPRPPKVPAPRKPSKFVKGESRESDYESDLESRFPVKWVPPGSDTDGEPSYSKIKLELKERRKKKREEKQKSPTPPTEFEVPPAVESPPRPKIDIAETVSALKQATSRENLTQETINIQEKQILKETIGETIVKENISARALPVSKRRDLSVSPQRPKPEALEMEKKWVPKKQTTDLLIIKEPIIHTEARMKSSSPLPSRDALQMEKQWGKKFGDTNIFWPPPGDESKPVVPWIKTETQTQHMVTSSSQRVMTSTSSVTTSRSERSCSSAVSSSFTERDSKSDCLDSPDSSGPCHNPPDPVATSVTAHQQEQQMSHSVPLSNKNLMSVAVVGQNIVHKSPPMSQYIDLGAVESTFEGGYLTGLQSSHTTTKTAVSSTSRRLCQTVEQTDLGAIRALVEQNYLAGLQTIQKRTETTVEPPVQLLSEMTQPVESLQDLKPTAVLTAVDESVLGSDEPRSEVVTESFGNLSQMRALWESKLHQEAHSSEEIRLTTKHELVSQNEAALTVSPNQNELVTVVLPTQPDAAPPAPIQELPFNDKVVDFQATVKHVKPLILEPFPFSPDPPRPKKTNSKLPPLTKPKKFIKGDFRESDYESDYEGRIKPKWVPSDSETEDLVYRPVQPRLQSRDPSRRHKERSPTPPTIFDTPPKSTGPPRPVIDIEERIFPEDHTSEPIFCPVTQPKEELIVRSTPYVMIPLPTTKQAPPGAKPVKQTPPSNFTVLTPEPPPQESYAYRPISNHIGVETTQRMKMEEATAISRRFVSLEQTTRVIKLDNRHRSRRDDIEVLQNKHELDNDGEGDRKRRIRQAEVELEPFPFVPEPSRVRPPKGTSAPKPKKFMKGESKESDYESDFEGVRFRSKWTPAGSDTEEPAYRKVKPPAISSDLQHRLERLGKSPTPPTAFDMPPELEGRPRPMITQEDVKNLKEILENERHDYIGQSSEFVANSALINNLQLKSSSRSASLRPIFNAPPPPPEDSLTPGEAPEFGYAEKPTPSTKVVASHFSNMSHSFRNRMQDFSNQILTDVRSSDLAPPSIPPTLESPTHQKQVQFQDIPMVQILEASSDATEDSNEPHAYKEESRVSEYGTKHIDPDTGLIYFKYDFGYEFGIVLPGEPKKVEKIQSSDREGDIAVPVIHEKSPRRESPQSLRKSPKQSPPSKRSSRHKPVPSESEVSDSEKIKIPNFKPKKITHAKAARWEPMSESEISELENTLERRGPSRYYKHRKDAFSRFEAENRKEASASPMSVSPSVSPYPFGPDSIASTPCDANATSQPLIVIPLHDLRTNTGRQICFECAAAGDWLIFCWSKGNQTIVPSCDYEITNKGGVSQLIIPEVFPEDTGSYTCTVTNQFGSASSTAFLRVEGEML